MKVICFLLLSNACYGQKDSIKQQKDTSKVEFTITTFDRNGKVIRKYNMDSVMPYRDSTFFIKPKID